MTITSLRRVTSARYIFLASGLVFILWSLTASLLPKSSALSALFQTDLDQSTTETDTATNASQPTPPQLGIPHAHIYLISLADRHDRRAQMELLRTAQNLTWTLVDGVPKHAPLVARILDWVAHERAKRGTGPSFRWPEGIDARAVSSAPWTPDGADAWADAPPPPTPTPTPTARKLACATDDDAIPAFQNKTPAWMTLSPAKIACWHAHVGAVRRFAQRPSRGAHDVAVLLEDDIDMEKDVHARLVRLWGALPAGWDVLFLGHCWSDEARYAPLAAWAGTSLRPSYRPKCTHAYVLSDVGARRVLEHLRYPPFAYSRALDQAYAWLVRSGRLRGYSVVPSLVVQRKNVHSDILPGSGSTWREGLRDGVFAV